MGCSLCEIVLILGIMLEKKKLEIRAPPVWRFEFAHPKVNAGGFVRLVHSCKRVYG